VNLNRLTLGARIVALGGLLLFIDSFLPWFKACADLTALGGRKVCLGSHNGWDNALSLLGVLLAIALVAVVVAEAAGAALPPLGNITWGQVQLAAGALVLLFVGLQVIIGDHGVTRSYGAYLGLVIAAGLAYGTFLRSREGQSPQIPRQHMA
jgi:hypothetical protein